MKSQNEQTSKLEIEIRITILRVIKMSENIPYSW